MIIGEQRSLEDFRSPVSRWKALACIIPSLLFAIGFDKFVLSGHLMLIGFSALVTGICLLIFRRALKIWFIPAIIVMFFILNIILSFILPVEGNSLPGIVFVPAVLFEFSAVYMVVNSALKFALRKP